MAVTGQYDEDKFNCPADEEMGESDDESITSDVDPTPAGAKGIVSSPTARQRNKFRRTGLSLDDRLDASLEPLREEEKTDNLTNVLALAQSDDT